jgi:hypothetical protein
MSAILLLAPVLCGALAAAEPAPARAARTVVLSSREGIEVRPDRAEFAAGEPVSGFVDAPAPLPEGVEVWAEPPPGPTRDLAFLGYAVTLTAASDAAPLACEPVRTAFRFVADERLERLAERLGRRFALFAPGEYTLHAASGVCAAPQDPILGSFAVLPDPAAITFDEMARGEPLPGTDADLAAALYERRVALGWTPPPELFSPAPAGVEIAHDGAPFYFRVRRGDALAVAGREGEELHNFNGAECGFNVGIRGRTEALRKDERPPEPVVVWVREDAAPGIYRVRCDVHTRTLGWLLVEEN